MLKLSVIMPVYNVEKYLPKCLDSLTGQTLKEIEIICINDGSSDSSSEILNRYAARDNRITVINQENQGQGNARNCGINLAKGEYIAFVDSDDWLENNAFEILYEKAKKFDADIVEFNYNEIFECSGQIKKHNYSIKLPENKVYNHKITKKYLFGTISVSWNKIYKRDFINEYNIRFGSGRRAQDGVFAIKAKVYAQKIIFENKPLYNYNIRQGSSVNSSSSKQLELFQSLADIKKFLIEENLYKTYKSDALKDFIKTISSTYNSLPESIRPEYLNLSAEFLGSDYPKLIKSINNGNNSFWENLFSVKNDYYLGCKRQKIITILGWKIRLVKK